MTIEGYMTVRRYWEVAGWALLLAVGFTANVATTAIDHARFDTGIDVWEIVVWEGTSHVVIGLLIPCLLWFDRRYPLAGDVWRGNLAAHTLFTFAWSLVHVVLMVWARIALYALFVSDRRYEFGAWWPQFGYEYLKDFRTYFLFLAILYLYRFVLRRLQGEAGYLSEGREETAAVDVADRFLIKKLGREFLVRVEDIDWIEASGNYVNLHVGRRVYPLRETMAGIAGRLTSLGFQRVHRSAIVNLDRVTEIVPYESGDGEARLGTDATVPVSRRFRKELRERLA